MVNQSYNCERSLRAHLTYLSGNGDELSKKHSVLQYSKMRPSAAVHYQERHVRKQDAEEQENTLELEKLYHLKNNNNYSIYFKILDVLLNPNVQSNLSDKCSCVKGRMFSSENTKIR